MVLSFEFIFLCFLPVIVVSSLLSLVLLGGFPLVFSCPLDLCSFPTIVNVCPTLTCFTCVVLNESHGCNNGSMNSGRPQEWYVSRKWGYSGGGTDCVNRGVPPSSYHFHRWLCWHNYSTCAYAKWRYSMPKCHRLMVRNNDIEPCLCI